MKKTKIIATLGPSTETEKKIIDLYKNGVNVIRLNYSHTDYDYFSKIIDRVKKLNKITKTNLGILTDTKGPEIRTKYIKGKIELDKNEIFIVTSIKNEKTVKNKNIKIISCDYDYIVDDLEIGDKINIDTGLLKAKVINKEKNNFIICKALNKHIVGSKRHINLPGVKLKLPGITKSDKKDIKFAVSKGTDYIALSFVRNKENIVELRNYLKKIKAEKNIKIISKIENYEAIKNIDEIIEESDGIMIARGDLGAETPYETVPIIQKQISEKCKTEGKFFIVATQMLESMIENPIPTRAETTDIFNAAIQKADCTMLSGETAIGKYPIESVKTMSKILEFTEKQIKYKHKDYFTKILGKNEFRKQILKNTIYTAEQVGAKNIVVFSTSGFTAKMISAFRPKLHVFAFTYTDEVRKKLTILFGLKTFQIKKQTDEENIVVALKELKEKKLVKKGDKIVSVYLVNKLNQMIPSIQIIEVK